MDFISVLETDMSVKILSCLDDPSDLVRSSAVSRSWRELVIQSGLCKQLCLRLFHQLSSIDHVIESNSSKEGSSESASSSNHMELLALERDHRAYALLARLCTTSPLKSCISEAIVASSTDNFPAESISNTLEPRDRIGASFSYWSSKGQHKSSVPESLLYKLDGDLCTITEINIQPFKAYFQPGYPIYSANNVRFKMGHYKLCADDQCSETEEGEADSDNYVWTYTSQEFPMSQENRLQSFKFPEPVVCIGGYLLVEFLGRVQRQEVDCLYYICMSHVQVIGRSLAGAFGTTFVEPSGKPVLKVLSYKEPEVNEVVDATVVGGEASEQSCRVFRQTRSFLAHYYSWIESDDDDDDDDDEKYVA